MREKKNINKHEQMFTGKFKINQYCLFAMCGKEASIIQRVNIVNK